VWAGAAAPMHNTRPAAAHARTTDIRHLLFVISPPGVDYRSARHRLPPAARQRITSATRGAPTRKAAGASRIRNAYLV
jgi:hypothetical protein